MGVALKEDRGGLGDSFGFENTILPKIYATKIGLIALFVRQICLWIYPKLAEPLLLGETAIAKNAMGKKIATNLQNIRDY